MMSAKTVSTDTASAAAPANNAGTAPAAAGDAATVFQNLLAGAVLPAGAALIATLPSQPVAPLLLVKNPAARTPAAAATAAPLGADVLPADMLKILDGAATLLPQTGEGDADAAAQVPAELLDTDELIKNDDDILSDWLEMMVPASVFAAQAGSNSAPDVSQGLGDAENKGGQTAVPVSLAQQALVSDQLLPTAAAPQGAGSAASVAVANRELLAAAQNPINAFAAALSGKTETTEKDKPSADGWMSALGDLSAKRGADVAPAAAPRLSTPVHDTRWADALAHRLVMMARDGESTASLKLVPQDLGPLDIQINVRDGEASVHFGAAHPETRAVLEASLPRLRELLGAQGLQLANASVSHQSGGQNRPEKSSGPRAIGAVAEETEVSPAQAVSTSLLDIYA
jgi:flagellar hook-length control protein FliK